MPYSHRPTPCHDPASLTGNGPFPFHSEIRNLKAGNRQQSFPPCPILQFRLYLKESMNYRKLLLNNNFLKFGFLFTLAMILVAGLWPFNFWAKNEVEWLKDRNGVHFYGQGIIFSAPETANSQSPLFADGPITIELWLQPESDTYPYLPRILSVYDGKDSEVFFFGQWKSHFAVSTQALDARGGRIYRNTGVENALSKGQERYIAITADEKETRIYIDGKLGLVYPNHSFAPKDRKGLKQIILGNSPSGKSYWKGNIYGLAIYQRCLTAEQVLQHSQDWIKRKPPFFSDGDNQSTISYFPFNERRGARIQDQFNRHGLFMLPRFEGPQKIILPPPWKDFRFNLSCISDMTINLLGFIPFGFFICALIRKRVLSGRQSSMVAILLGFSLSLSVELIQAYLPTRNSQLMDVLTNTIGTSLGTVLFHFSRSLTTRKPSKG
jgi:glycopeptide antibiotics resistance protein